MGQELLREERKVRNVGSSYSRFKLRLLAEWPEIEVFVDEVAEES